MKNKILLTVSVRGCVILKGQATHHYQHYEESVALSLVYEHDISLTIR